MAPRVFAVAAHPDDIEFLMAGTLLLLRQAGCELHYLNIANGCYGSAEQPPEVIRKIRRGEAQNACRRLGATWHPPLVDDVEVFYDKPTMRQVSAVMREVSPDVILTLSPWDYMEDHMNAARLAVTGAFVRGITFFPVEPPRRPTYQPVALYHAQPYGNDDIFGDRVVPKQFVDVTSVIDEKTALLAEHRSQKEWLDRSQGLDAYLEEMRRQTRDVGEMSGRFEYAEGWRRHNHRGFCAAATDPLQEILGARIFRRA